MEHGQRVAYIGRVTAHHATLLVHVDAAAGGIGHLVAAGQHERGAALYLQVMPTAPAVGDYAGLVPATVPIVLEAGKVQGAVGGNLRGNSQQLVAQRGTAPLREKG